MADSDRTQRLLRLAEWGELDSPGGLALQRAVLTDVEGAYPAAGGANPLPVPAATQTGHAVNKGQLDLKQDISFDPTGGATGAQSLTVPEYAGGRVDSFEFVPSAKRAAVFTARTGSDVTTELQAFVDYCKANRRRGVIRAGYYTISDTLWLTRTAFEGVDIQGEGSGYDIGTGAAANAHAPTTIDASAVTTKPSVAVQFGRNVRLADLAILGPNLAPAALATPTNTAADWLTSGVRDARYSPQCAIAIDPTNGNDPGGGAGYPGLTYAGLPGSGTSGVLLERLQLRNHNVGVVTSPGGTTSAQGDHVTYRDLNTLYCHIAYANCQAQANAHAFYGGNVGGCRTVWDTLTYGNQAGPPPRAFGGQYGPCYALFALNDSLKEGLLVGVFGESVLYLGTYGTGATTGKYPLKLKGCEIHLRGNSASPPFVLQNNGSVELDGCAIIDDDRYLDVFHVHGTGLLTLRNLVAKIANPDRPLVVPYHDLAKPVLLESARLFGASSFVDLYGDGPRLFSLPSRVTATHHTKRLFAGQSHYLYAPGRFNSYVSGVGSASSYVFDTTAKTVTFSLDDGGLLVAGVDVLEWRMSAVAPAPAGTSIMAALKVSTITGSGPYTVTCAMLADPTLYDQTYAPASPSVVTAEWAPGAAVTLTTTSGSTAATASVSGLLKAGDWLANGLSGIPNWTRVAAASGTSVTLSRQATASGTVTVYYGRLQSPTLTAAF